MISIPFAKAGRLPAETDNVAIASQQLEAGTTIDYHGQTLMLSHTVLCGHRFAVQPIAQGEALLSWGQTFGLALKPIQPGEYVCNADVLRELRRRSLKIDLPLEANFQNDLEKYTFDAANFQPATPLPRHSDYRTFSGYARSDGRGVGTRNMIVLLGVTSLVSGFVRQLESRLQNQIVNVPHLDGVVAIAHTEGGHGAANNEDLLLRTLAGFIVNPNVAAVLIVDDGHQGINNSRLQAYLDANHYPLADVPHHFMSLTTAFEQDLAAAAQVVMSWLPVVSAMQRTPQPLSALKIGLQCGGSDAFSGISGNPLAAWVAKEVIQYGGAANLAETDELIGAEAYTLAKVRDEATVEKFLSVAARFKERVGWHGHSADGNPSGGNKFRGLYNIYLKSLGAATKRHPDVPLDYVIEYGELMQESGYYFMDSPGNDLESVAGQVAAGCNLILFVTGNGSITNFPFVPTIKIVTTTERYELLINEMDINAGAYLDGTPMPELGAAALDYTIEVAGGRLSVGEKAGHTQVQIWRDWRQTRPVNLEVIRERNYSGAPIPIRTGDTIPQVQFSVYGARGTTDQVGLILPTSLCSGQIARMCVDTLNKQWQHPALSRFVTLVHTEGCGASMNDEFSDTLLGYLAHPFVKHALLLEHGCEATHNDYFRQALQQRGYDPQDYGWASIQMDGGIQKVIQKMVTWFDQQLADSASPSRRMAGLENVRLALVSNGTIPESVMTAYAQLTQMVVSAGGIVIVPEHEALLQSTYAQLLGLENNLTPSVHYAQTVQESGFYIMAMPTHDWGEILTGLGAGGVEIILNAVDQQTLPGHPMIPVLQISTRPAEEIDFVIETADPLNGLLAQMINTLDRRYHPKTAQSGNVYFQITRGLLGVSL
jgi:altronate dehydratase